MSDGYDSELAMLFADYNPLVDVASSTHFRPLSTAPNPHPTEWRTTPIWHGGRDRHTPGGQEWHDQPYYTESVPVAPTWEVEQWARPRPTHVSPKAKRAIQDTIAQGVQYTLGGGLVAGATVEAYQRARAWMKTPQETRKEKKQDPNKGFGTGSKTEL